MNFIIVAGVSILRNGKILLLKEKGSGNWGPPAGHGEKGETLREVAIRETKEESGLDVTLNGIVRCGIYKVSEDKSYLIAIFSAKSKSYKLSLQEEEVAESGWFSKEDLINKKIKFRHPLLEPIIFEALKGTVYPLSVFEEMDIKI